MTICAVGERLRFDRDTRVRVACAAPGRLLRLTVLAAGPGAALDVEASGGACVLPLAAGSRVYLPGRRLSLRTPGRLEARLDVVAGWPLRAPLLLTDRALRSYGCAADPLRAVGGAARDMAAFVAAGCGLAGAAASRRIGLLADARLLRAVAPPVVAELELPVAAVDRLRPPA